MPSNPQPNYPPFGKWADVNTNNPTWTTSSVGIGYSSSSSNSMLQVKDFNSMANNGISVNLNNYLKPSNSKYGVHSVISGLGAAIYGKATHANGFSLEMEGKAYFSGNVGIGTKTPSEFLELKNGNIVLGSNNHRFVMMSPVGNGEFISFAPEVNGAWDLTNAVSIYKNGTLEVKKKLYVNEKIFAKEIEVKLPPFPDFVFTTNYDVPSLPQIEKFIDANGHLPFYKNAESYENGFANLGELNVNTVEAVEVLYLHIIALNKELEALKKEINELKK